MRLRTNTEEKLVDPQLEQVLCFPLLFDITLRRQLIYMEKKVGYDGTSNTSSFGFHLIMMGPVIQQSRREVTNS